MVSFAESEEEETAGTAPKQVQRQPTGIFKVLREEDDDEEVPAGPGEGLPPTLPPSRHALGWAAEAAADGGHAGVGGVALGLGVAALVAAIACGYLLARRRGA